MGAVKIVGSGLLGVPVIPCFPGMRGYQTVPDRAVGVTVASGVSNNTYGTSTQITAGLPYDAYIVGALLGSPGDSANDAYAQLGIDLGPSSGTVQTVAEAKLLANFVATGTGNTAQTPVMFPFPVFVPAGTRIAAKTARSTGAVSYLIHLLVVPASEVRTLTSVRDGKVAGLRILPEYKETAAIRSAGTGRGSVMVPAASLAAGAACTSGTTPAYGSYVQVAANLKFDYLITHILFGLLGTSGQTFVQCGLGLGAAGAEYSISDIVLLRETAITGVAEVTWSPITLPIGLLVPAGTRLAARIATSGSAITGNIDVTGYYVRNLATGPGLG